MGSMEKKGEQMEEKREAQLEEKSKKPVCNSEFSPDVSFVGCVWDP